jgi:hypothetical protein
VYLEENGPSEKRSVFCINKTISEEFVKMLGEILTRRSNQSNKPNQLLKTASLCELMLNLLVFIFVF